MTDTSDSVIRPSKDGSVPEILRSIVREGGAWVSAGIIGEAANLLDDTDALLGRLAECFGDDETEFSDIKLMRDRIAAVDTRPRHDATDESAKAHAPKAPAHETGAVDLENFSISQSEAEKAFADWQEKKHVTRGTRAAFIAGWHARSSAKASGCPTHGLEHFFEGMCIKCGVVPPVSEGEPR